MDLHEFCTRINSPLSCRAAGGSGGSALVLHRNIKPENLLINIDMLQVKLIDFGCVVVKELVLTEVCR